MDGLPGAVISRRGPFVSRGGRGVKSSLCGGGVKRRCRDAAVVRPIPTFGPEEARHRDGTPLLDESRLKPTVRIMEAL
jgi:hypothetical protein